MYNLKIKKFCFGLLGVIFLSYHFPIAAQRHWNPDSFNDSRPGSDFLIKTYSIAGRNPEKTQMALFCKIPYDHFQFIAADSLFRAGFEITIQILENKTTIIADTIKKYRVEVSTFEETNSRHDFTEKLFLFNLKPGQYEYIIHLQDLETQKSLIKKNQFTVPDYNQNYSLSDILFLKSKPDDLNIQNITPLYPPVRSVADSEFYAFFYIVTRIRPVSMPLVYTIQNIENKVILQDSVRIEVGHEIVPVLLPLDKHLDFGQYTLHLRVPVEPEFSVSAPFFVQWGIQSVHITDIEILLDPLKFIMDHDVWKQIQKMDSEEQRKAVQSFWKDHDPTPESVKNELEEEFFRRVIFSNRFFSTHAGAKNGWNTDQGRIYIVYGQPSEIERSNIASESQYEIWFYKHLGKKFVFMKKSMTSVFYLVSEE